MTLPARPPMYHGAALERQRERVEADKQLAEDVTALVVHAGEALDMGNADDNATAQAILRICEFVKHQKGWTK